MALGWAAVHGDDCSVSNSDKQDCGFIGITESECTSKGCCWDSSVNDGTPWCFNKAGASSNCFVMNYNMKRPFSDDELDTMRGYFEANINIESKGGVVAAPDYDTPGGSYYYHWMRDGALTMRTYQEIYSNFTEIESTMKSYVQWVLDAQAEEDPNGQDVRTEPKFELPNGEVFTGAWCRPQNDGPGLQATALMMFADTLIANDQSDYVSTYLWTNDPTEYYGGAIKRDLDYIVSGFATSTCDLWEEIRSTNLFWNRLTMKKAMGMGADFASRMGDEATASSYRDTEQKINSTLYDDHWSGSYVLEDTSRTKDSAVIVGFNAGYDSSDGMYNPSSYEVASTVSSYNSLFCNEYKVNTDDSAKGITGVLYGRYGGDTYAGGNPWVLSTAALGQLLYRAASYILDNGVPDSTTLAKWAEAFNADVKDLPTDSELLAEVFAAAGDGVLLRLRTHVQGYNWHLAEQLDRNTGAQISAEDLTWSYAEVLNAMRQRDIYISKT